MSRGKIRPTSDICADCSALDPTWASINRGVLICDECCSVHRSLGRHISQVKSLKKGSWNPTELQMVHQLVSQGANSIWEHSLLDPGQNKQGRRKPNARDPVHKERHETTKAKYIPTKADFIRAKYQFLAFSKKHQDGEYVSSDDLNRQLHSCVRTNNVETCLRLLSLGADPNYLNPEKGNYPLHVAAASGQATQVELLVVYGSDPGAPDILGKTPIDHARNEGHTDLADRLVECQYELTDRLAYYLCGRKPDHKTQHFIIPQMADSSLDLSELAKAAKKKLQALSNHLFEELAMDTYDEVDRRENDAIWLSTQNHSTLVMDRQSIPFLPVNPELSSTRNQGRQKLARFNAREFTTLVIDILSEARRRQLGIGTQSHSPPALERAQYLGVPRIVLSSTHSLTPSDDSSLYDSVASQGETPDVPRTKMTKSLSNISDDEPLYDSVASDEDYSTLDQDSNEKGDDEAKKPGPATSAAEESMASGSEHSDNAITLEEYMEVKRTLAASEAKCQQLEQKVNNLSTELKKVVVENEHLKKQPAVPDAKSVANGHSLNASFSAGTMPRPAKPTPANRPQSMFEQRDNQRPVPKENTPICEDPMENAEEPPATKKENYGGRTKPAPNPKPVRITCDDSDYENTKPKRISDSGSLRSDSSQFTSSEGSQTPGTPSNPEGHLVAAAMWDPEDQLPSQDDVVRKTERITKKIQELLISAQEGKHASYAVCSDKIHAAVLDMATIFPQKPKTESIKMALHYLTSSAVRLREECRMEQMDGRGQVDHRIKTQQVIQCAYDIAKGAKQLVTIFQ
ncbi:ARF GTPase-activating protein GIT1-like isoform X3 [Lineus longissimus]|uniref:ARF GTPase-activating protein GIT1-like isoform X3 n=1 Tax=Lineus longissimus TaxID=88925 RepID=UPI00315D0A69